MGNQGLKSCIMAQGGMSLTAWYSALPLTLPSCGRRVIGVSLRIIADQALLTTVAVVVWPLRVPAATGVAGTTFELLPMLATVWVTVVGAGSTSKHPSAREGSGCCSSSSSPMTVGDWMDVAARSTLGSSRSITYGAIAALLLRAG
jgi:hypothetical protein